LVSREGIRDGTYPEAAPLPSETVLAETYRVTRMTARQAVDVLKAEGLVRSEHGRGVFVRRRPVVIRSARNRFTREFRETGKGAYDVEMKALGRTPKTELVELGPVVPPAEVAERLRLDPGEQALIRRRRMYADDDPMQLATSFVPWSLAEGTQMTTPDSGRGGIYSRLADMGHQPVRFTEDVEIRMATEDEARFLDLPAPEPVFYLVRTAFDASDRPVEICEHVMPGDRWALTYEWVAD
jgi:GntR family transcriptional regulator